jgi:hypothetical protein
MSNKIKSLADHISSFFTNNNIDYNTIWIFEEVN